jgi:hypothetical protein
MRLRPPRSARARARFRPLFFCALWMLALGCAVVEFLTTRSSLSDATGANVVAGFVGICVLLYSGMLIYHIGADYRPRRALQLVVATLFSAGASVNLLLVGVRTLHLSLLVAASGSALLTVAAFRFTLGKVGRESRWMVGYHVKTLRDRGAADAMYRASVEVLRANRLHPDDYQTARVNGPAR